VDFTSNPAEVIGLDNICLTNGLCGCLIATNEVVDCIDTNKTYQYKLCVTNQFSGPISYLSFVDLPTGVTFSPDIYTLSQPLNPGQGTCVTIYVTNSAGVSNICFTLGAHTTNFVRLDFPRLCQSDPGLAGQLHLQSGRD
jgi:hypothetical protein